MKIKAIALALASGLCATGAQADHVGRPYAFVSLGGAEVDLQDATVYYEDRAAYLNATGASARDYTDDASLAAATGAGFQFNEFLAVEGFLRYYGTFEAGVKARDSFGSWTEKDELTAAGFGVGVIGFLPLTDIVSLFARADMVALTVTDDYSESDAYGPYYEWSTEDTNLKGGVGVGVQFNFDGGFSLRTDVQHIEAEIDNEDMAYTTDIDSINVTGLLAF